MEKPAPHPHPFDDLIGPHRPLGIGISVGEFMKDGLPLPSEAEVAHYSQNPRNRYGDWYEDKVEEVVRDVCARRGWTYVRRASIGQSKIYRSNKIVDVLINGKLGLELKFLKGTGSLVGPKSVIDALDFTNRPMYCLYVIDGPGWRVGRHVEYLSYWWDFTCLKQLETTLVRFDETHGL